MEKFPTLHEFDKMTMERFCEKISRRYIAEENAMLVLFDLKKGAVIPEHQYVSEQITNIVKDKVKVTSGGKKFVVGEGELLQIPPNTPHEFLALEDTYDIDVFAPIRKDWLDGKDNYLKKSHLKVFCRDIE